MDKLNRIELENRYVLEYSDADNWNIYRYDGSLINKNNLPAYTIALVRYIITGSHLCNKVYKAFRFEVNKSGIVEVDNTNIIYSSTPIKEEIYKSTHWYCSYHGQIPYEGKFDAEKFKKIVYNKIAKFKAQEASL